MNTHFNHFPEAQTYRNNFSMRVSPIIGEFSVTDDQMILSNRRPKLNDERPNFNNVDLVKSFDPTHDLQTNHGIHHLFDYLEKVDFFSKFYKTRDKFQETEFTFVCGRYVLTRIEKFSKGNIDNFEILAFRKDDIVYIGLNRTMIAESIRTNEHRLATYAGLQFGSFLTKSQISTNFKDTVSIVKKIRIIDHSSNRAHSIIVSSTVRAFDKNNITPIEIHLKKETKNLRRCMDEWSFSALLAGSRTIVYGTRDDNYKIKNISTTTNLKRNHGAALKMIGQMLTEVAKIIENEKCVVIKPSLDQRGDLTFEKTDISYMGRSDQW